MTDVPRRADGRTIQLVALALALLSVVAFFTLIGGVIDYLIIVACAVAAVIFGVRGVLRPGWLRWVVLAGAVVASFILLTSSGLLVLRMMRVLS